MSYRITLSPSGKVARVTRRLHPAVALYPIEVGVISAANRLDAIAGAGQIVTVDVKNRDAAAKARSELLSWVGRLLGLSGPEGRS